MKAWIKTMELMPAAVLTLQLDADDVKYQIAKTRCCGSLNKLVGLLKFSRETSDFGAYLDNDIEETQRSVLRSLRTRKALYDLRQPDGSYVVKIRSNTDGMKRIGRAHYYRDVAPACEFEFEYTEDGEWEADLIDVESGIDD